MILLNAAATLAAGVLTGGLALGVGVAQHEERPAGTSGEGHAVSCHGRADLPAALRSDLRSAREKPVGERRTALRAVRDRALHGDYGRPTQQWAVHRIHRQARIAAHRPEELRQDLRAVRRLPADQRVEARKAIRSRVLDGDYGATTKQRLERRVEHRKACAGRAGAH